MGSFKTIVILVDSRSATETIALQHLSESLIADIDGNEKADLLVNRGPKSHMEKIAIQLDSLERCVSEKIMLNYNMDQCNKSSDKYWVNIAND
ncbi:hypothetical protein NPIL_673551 [Nephila pilipes]|uniref:Uncharacterized protein n=1 Tax=Nephila pilipes TaxID=299642 RepID=A0A8X6IU46_NEPPI|nr:hypothetical protein NPIL_673551 [Nephila pilipes]